MPASVYTPCTLDLQPLTLPRDDRSEKSGLIIDRDDNFINNSAVFRLQQAKPVSKMVCSGPKNAFAMNIPLFIPLLRQ